jgi:hypothetical protein
MDISKMTSALAERRVFTEARFKADAACGCFSLRVEIGHGLVALEAISYLVHVCDLLQASNNFNLSYSSGAS